MNKIMFALLGGFASLSVSAATLDVHGDIKISGQSVINENGEWVGKPISVAGKSFTPDEFTSMDGRILRYKTVNFVYDGVEEVKTEGTAIFDYSKPEQFKEFEYDKDGILLWGVERQSTGSNSFVNYYPTNGSTNNATFNTIVSALDRWELNKTYTSIIDYKTNWTQEDGLQSEQNFTEVSAYTPIAILDSYSQGEIVKNAECLVYTYSDNYRDQYRIACKGIGLVKIWTESNGSQYVLTDYE